MLSGDCLRRVLHVDLTAKIFRVEERPELFDRWLGGAGVAAQLLFGNCAEGADPLGPENPIIMAVGPLTSLFPLASKTVAMFKSPHTGNLGESHRGGRSAVAIRMAGYGAIVISGKSDRPVYVDEERWRRVLSSLVICFFARNLYDRETTRKALALAGFQLSAEQLDAFGADIHAEKYRFKTREGFALDTVRIPKRILETPLALGVVDEGYLRETLDHARRMIAERTAAK